MIFQIDLNLLERIHDAALSDLVSAIMDGRHYIRCRPNVRAAIEEAINKNASTTQFERFQNYHGFDIPTNLGKYVTTMNLSDFDDEQIQILITKPSWLIMENELNEWPVYKNIIQLYQKDRRFGDLYKLLSRVADKTLVPHSTGGYGQFIQTLIDYDTDCHYHGTLRYKSCTLVDRDTTDATYYDGNKSTLYKFLSGKEIKDLTDTDIYTTEQSPYIWHMWYKCAIENYFPKENYRMIHADTSKIPDNEEEKDYLKFDESIYHKRDLSKLTQGMTYSKYEQSLKRFPFYGTDISELQLFLLKLVKII